MESDRPPLLDTSPGGWIDLMRPVLERGWNEARRTILHAGRLAADDDVWMLSNPDQMGDPAARADRWMHQYIAAELSRTLPGVAVVGEEHLPNALLLDPNVNRYLAYVDAIDGSRQAFSLPGCWGIPIVAQQHLGGADAHGYPRCAMRYIGIVDAEGVVVATEEGVPYAEMNVIGTAAGSIFSDQLIVQEGDNFGITGDLTLLVSGYKPEWWPAFAELRTRLRSSPVFNTAGAPVTRKVLQNSDVVVVQTTRSTLWDGAGAGVIAAAGGFVMELGTMEPLPASLVLDWYSQFGYQRRTDEPGRLIERRCIPRFVAGMDWEHVLAVGKATVGLEGLDDD
jgi:hypothetical protein